MSNFQSDKLIRSEFYRHPDHFYQGANSKSFDKSIQKNYFDYYDTQNSFRQNMPNFEILKWLSEYTEDEDFKECWATLGIASTEVTASCLAKLMFDDNPYVPILVLQINHFYDLKTYEDVEPDYHRFFGYHRVISVKGKIPLEACWTEKLRSISITQSVNIPS
jgi:hypothetical protein